MPESLRDSHKSEPDNAAVSLVWTVHLARHEPGKLLVTMLACLVVALTGYAFFRNPFPVIITLAALLAAVSDFLLPVTYRLGRAGASSTSFLLRREMRWDEVRACHLDDFGVKLSPIGHPSRREAFRGVYLRFGGNREAVIDAVRALRKNADD